MPRVRLAAPLPFNLTGYDREAVLLPAGEQDVPEVVAAFVAANPAVGDVLGKPTGSPPVLPAESPKTPARRRAAKARP